MNRSQSEHLYEEALKHIVGGVNSPSRSFKAVGGGAPVFMKKAEGAYFGTWTATATSIIWPPTGRSLPDTPIRM
ncbi:hypothetical protein HMSSN036_37800 [Paenibacillus macerans]|nr:hypothetical protein HMSSN036_37800 [Paenibacillus macerans]